MDGVTGMERATDRPDSSPRRPVSVIVRKPVPPMVLVVGASTGGPQALTALVANLTSIVSRLPICVTLHMPTDLMPLIAAHVTRTCGVETKVVEEPTPLLAGTVYFAPGDRHLEFKRKEPGKFELCLRPGLPGEACRLAVDVMFNSAAACFGSRVLAVVLSGMGQDGLSGARAVTDAGGSVLVQDKASSAVWGMPGAIAKANLAAAILSPTGIAEEVVQRVMPKVRSSA